MKSISKRVDWIIEKAQRLGYDCDYKYAQTGTCYITCECLVDDGMDCITKTIRVADHADAYGNSDYTADDCEGTDKGAVEFLANLIGKTYRDSFKKKQCRRYALVAKDEPSCSHAFSSEKNALDWMEKDKQEAIKAHGFGGGDLSSYLREYKLVKLVAGKLANGQKPTWFEK